LPKTSEYEVLLVETRAVTFRVYVDAESPEAASELALNGEYDEEEVVDEAGWGGAIKVVSVQERTEKLHD